MLQRPISSKMYSDKVNRDREIVKSLIRDYSLEEKAEILNKVENEIPTLKDVAILLNIDESQYSKLIELARQKTLDYHGNSVGLIAPLYVSSYCVNDCKGCNYRRSNEEIKRKVLSLNEFKDEINAINELGYLTLEIVSGSFIPNNKIYRRFLEFIEHAKQKLKKSQIENLAFSIDALTEKEYSEFVDANLILIQWQESYDMNAYLSMVGEKTGTKSNINKRMNTYEEWIKAGGKRFGLGILAGLSDNFFEDVLMVIAHGKYLEKNYGISPSVIGIPRMQEAYVGESRTFKQRSSISDENLLKMVSAYRLCFPKANIVASTREPQDVIKQILFSGGTFTNHTCSTNVGGYPVLKEILNKDISYDEKKKLLEAIQRGKNQQFFHPDPLFDEMLATIESVGKKIDSKKEF